MRVNSLRTCLSWYLYNVDHFSFSIDSLEEFPGYDFVEKPPEEFICHITRELLQDPFQTRCCGNHLSQEATKRLQRDQKLCPFCKQPLHVVPDKYFRRKVMELQVRCSKKAAGCGWVGELGNLDHHLNVCQYIEIACPNSCDGRVLRRDLDGHKANDCPKRQFACKHCGYEATYQEITEDHLPKCKKYPLECPNSCGERDIERQHLHKHLHDCPLEVIECEFDYAGCTEKVKRRKMQSHVESSVNAHLQLVAAHDKLQTKRIEQQEKQIRALTSQVHLLKTTLQSVFIPPPIFTMSNFKQHKNDKDRWFSPPFNSHFLGYKMCIGVCANGYGEGEGTHLSVFVHMMPGECDEYLRWPFCGEVTVQLLDQRRNMNHEELALLVETDYSSKDIYIYTDRVKGIKEHGPGWGYDEVISYQQLTRKNSQYLKNDCLKFQVNKVVVLGQL